VGQTFLSGTGIGETIENGKLKVENEGQANGLSMWARHSCLARMKFKIESTPKWIVEPSGPLLNFKPIHCRDRGRNRCRSVHQTISN
jgi:hypothetical protein